MQSMMIGIICFTAMETNDEENDLDDIEQLITQFLTEYISEQKRICIFKQRGFVSAIIRIIDITESEYDQIVKSFESKQPKNLTFLKYIDQKSFELRESYQYIYDKCD